MLAAIFFLIFFAIWGLTGSFVLATVIIAIPLVAYVAVGHILSVRSQRTHQAELAKSYENALRNIR